MSVLVNPYIHSVAGPPPEPGEIDIIQMVMGIHAGINNPTAVFDNPPPEDTLILMLLSNDGNSASWGSWDTGYGTVISGDMFRTGNSAVSAGAYYHWVTAAEEAANTVSFGPRIFSVNETGEFIGIALSGVDRTDPIAAYNVVFNEFQPQYTVAGIPDTDTIDGGLAISLMDSDTLNTIDAPSSDWIVHDVPSSTHTTKVYVRAEPTTAGVAVPDELINVSAPDDFISLTILLRPAA